MIIVLKWAFICVKIIALKFWYKVQWNHSPYEIIQINPIEGNKLFPIWKNGINYFHILKWKNNLFLERKKKLFPGNNLNYSK